MTGMPPPVRLFPVLCALWLLCAGGPLRAGSPPAYEVAYQKARTAYYRFKADKEKQKFRHHWQRVAKKFEQVADRYPDSPRAADALFTAGRLYHDLYLISRVSPDLDASIRLFGELVERFPANHLSDDAQLYIALKWVEYHQDANQARKELSFLVERFPQGDVTPKARRMLEDLGGSLPKEKKPEKGPKASDKAQARVEERPVLERIRHWSNPAYTRVSLYTRTKAAYKVGRLEAEDKAELPPRLYIDLMNAGRSSDLTGSIEVRDSVVRRIRVAEREGGVIRVVVDLDGDRQHRVFPMNDPARVVVDVTAGEDAVARVIEKKQPPKKTVREIKKKSRPGASLSLLAGLKVKRVVIDPGHGGNDPGAIGPTGVLEKEIALDLAKRLKRLLQKNLKIEVLLTRNSDRSLDLEARTAFANKHNADLFVSIHLNAHRNRKYRGVEVFYLDLTDDRYSIKLAARENATSEKSISDLEVILADLALKSHVDDSISLSRFVQKAMVGSLRRKYKNVRDLGLKPALFYVLIGARMPSILVEASFLSNPTEEKRLRSKTYRQLLAQGIYTGIKNFIHERDRMLNPL